MTISKKPSNPGLSDPVLARQTEADLAKASLIAKGKPTVTSAGELILPSTTVSTTSNSFTTTTSANNQPADIVTVTKTSGTVYVNSIDQTIQQTVINNPVAGVSSIIAGNNITITSTGTSGTGDVTINSTLPLANGSSNFNIATSGGNATVTVAGLETWTFDTTGNITIPGDIIGTATINIDNRATGNSADINLYSADDILIQARDRDTGSTSEGGDINIFAGDSAEDGDSSGGDVVIEAGNGGASNTDYGGSGGFITLQSGRGGAASTGVGGESAQSGGSLNLRAGNGGDNNGNIARGAQGGSIYIDAGDSTGNGVVGGSIYLSTGLAGPNAEAGDLQIQVPSSDSGPGGTWRFDGQGVLELPGGGTIRNDGSLDIGGGDAISLEAGGVVNIYSDTNGNAYQWQFGDDGNLTLPSNSSSINYANGTPYGGGSGTGNVTFSNVTVQGDNNALNLSAGADFTANLAYLQVRAGDVASHIHFDTGNSQAYDLFVGNDDKYVQVSSTGNIIMSSYDGNTSYIMTLDNTGDLILAGGSSIIRSVANSSLDPINPNVSTMIFTPDPGYSSQSLVLDPTLPGHIHLRAPGANIDEPLANIFLGGETSSFEIGYHNGNAPNAFIHSGGNTWEFLNDGNLVFPRDDSNGDPILTIVGGANPGITSTDISLAGPANLDIISNYTKFTGSSGEAITIYPNDGEISGDANIQIWSNLAGNTQYSWTFGNDGMLTVPYEGAIRSVDDTIILQSYDSGNSISRNMRLGTNGGLFLEQTGLIPINNRTWLTIDPNVGNPIISASVGVVGNAAGGNISIAGGAADQFSLNTSAGGNVNIVGGLGASDDGGGGGPGGSVNITSGASADPAGVNGNVVINTGGSNNWTFDYTGNLTLPGNTFAVNYANGAQVSIGGGGGNTGNVTFDDVTIQGVNVLNLSAGPDFTANLAYLQLRAGDVASHIHLETGNATAYDLIIGDDQKFVQVSSTGNIIMSSYDGNTSYSMTLDTTGNLTTPSNLVIGPTGFGAGTGFTQSDSPLLLGSSEANGRASLIWYENPTGPGNVVQVGLNDSTPGSMTVLTGDYSTTTYVWDFDNTGNLTLPTGGNLIISGSIVSSGASPAPTLSGFSSVSALQFTNGNSNVTINANSNTWVFDSTGNLNLPGNAVAIKFANGSAAFGNIAAINLNGNTSQVLYGNGVFAAAPTSTYGDSNVVSLLGTFGSNTISTTGNIATGSVTAAGKIGYASGSTVTQTTNRGTSVTINALAGTIVTVSASMVAGFIDTFGVSNDKVDPNNDIVLVQIVSPNFGMYNVIAQPSAIINGFNNGFFLNIQNISGGPSSNEAITIRFMVIKAPNA
jgi:hypothetical protein